MRARSAPVRINPSTVTPSNGSNTSSSCQCPPARRSAVPRGSSGVGRQEAGEQFRISGELLGVLQHQAGGADQLAGDSEGRDLDDLALTAGGRADLLLCPGDVFLGGDRVAAIG